MPSCFVIDPLDGSNNYIHGLDYYCISLAMVEFGRPQVGLILRPPTGESYQAIADTNEAWYKHSLTTPRRRLFSTVKDRPLRSCLLATHLGFNSTSPYRQLHGKVQATRRMGSAALDMCYVAAGKFDGHCASNLSPWDVAAAAAILPAANIITSNFQGEEMDCFGQTFLAAPAKIYQQLQTILNLAHTTNSKLAAKHD